jgi:adenylate cyclase
MSRALLIDPDNLNMRYNFACALSVHLKETQAAIDMLQPVLMNFAGGFLHHAKVDPDLDPVRNDPRFKTMIAAAEARIAAASD